MSIQILVTSDNHLDPPAVYFGPRRSERRNDHLRCFEEVIEYAKANKPDLLLMGGDVFDTMRPSNYIRARVMEHFKRLHDLGIKIFLVSGHHDTPKSVEEGVSPLAVYGNSGYATFFPDASKPTRFDLNVSGIVVSVFGLSHNPIHPVFQGNQDLLANMDLKPHGSLNILLTHYPIEGFSGYSGDEPVMRLASIPRDFQLIAAGHFHGYQTKRLGNTTIVYPGSTERASFQEEGEEKGFAWAEISKEGDASVDHLRTSARPYRTLETEFPKQSSPLEVIKQKLNENSDTKAVARLKLLGTVTVEQLSTYRRSELLTYAQNKFFHLSIDEGELQIQSPEPLQALPRSTPLEELRRYFMSAMEQASEEEKEVHREALKLSETKLREAGAW